MADMYEVPKEVRQERIESLAKKFDLYNALSIKFKVIRTV